MNVLIPLLVVMPIVGAGITMALWRHVRMQQAVGVAVLGGCTAASLFLLAEVAKRGPVAVHLGGWEAPIGIILVADLLSALLLSISLTTVLAVFVFAIGQPREDKGAFYFHPLFLVLAAGVSASFLTGDLFNLFVAFEIMLCSSYVLITLGGGPKQVRTGMTYVVINMVASTLLVSSVGLIYAATGSVNMADLSGRLDQVPEALRSVLGALLFLTFGIKAAIFPLFFWLPDSYPTAPVTVTAVFAGLLTKIGVYAIIRTQTLLFPSQESVPFILILAAATMAIGVLGAIAQDDMKRILSFHIVSQIGYMLFGLGLFTAGGIAGAVFFVLHQIPVKTCLFLVNGIVETITGTAALHSLGGISRRIPFAAVMFMLSALSLAGLPPFSGFFGKVALLQAGFSAGAWTVSAISIVVSFLTLFSMTKIWGAVFWGEPRERLPVGPFADKRPTRPTRLMMAGTSGLVAVTIAIAVFAQPLWRLCHRAAEELLNPGAFYVKAVLGP